MLDSLKENDFTVKFSKVKSHNGNSLNELADLKAREAIKAYKRDIQSILDKRQQESTDFMSKLARLTI